MVSRETFLRRFTSLAAALVLVCGSAASCSKPEYTEEEVRTALEELLPLSFELNEIYFGEGLPISDDRADVERFYASFDTDVASVNYHPVAEDCEYQSVGEIKAETERVFTPAYCQYLYEMAFSGISAVFDEGTEKQLTATASYARYLESNGVLTVRLDLPYNAMTLDREYDLDGMEIVREMKDYVLVSVPTEAGGKPLDVELKLVMTADGFRLDTPTY